MTASGYTTAVAQHGLTTGFGDTGSVGIGGITLAGGVGFLVRKHGLTIDGLPDAEGRDCRRQAPARGCREARSVQPFSGAVSSRSANPLTSWHPALPVAPITKINAMVSSTQNRPACHPSWVCDRRRDAKSSTGPTCASLSGLTIELMLLI